MADWVALVNKGPKAFKALVKKALSSASCTRAALPKGVISIVHEFYSCDICSRAFMSYQSMSLHKCKMHGCVHEAHYLIGGTQCPVCLTEFHSRSRVLEHVMYKGHKFRCFHNLLLRGRVLSAAQVVVAQQQVALESKQFKRAGRRRAHAFLPACRAQGPKLPVLLDRFGPAPGS
eukprot:9492850-Karenia_brevis.AAC.1